jgi:hypothetical protein
MPVLLLGVTLLSACNPSTNATIEQTTFTVPSKQFREAFAVCPSGSRALGGGVVQRGSAISLEVQASGPLDSTGVTANTVDGDVAAQWYAAVRNDGPGTVTFRVFAICSSTSDATIEATSLVGPDAQGYAYCPSGRRALGGGVVQSGSPNGLVLAASGPLDETSTTLNTNDGDIATEWWASVRTREPAPPVKVFAICASNVDATIEQSTFVTDANNGQNEAYAYCPDGKRALGGGVVESGDPSGLHVRASGPLDETSTTLNTNDGDIAAEWYASVRNGSGSSRTWRVFAVCE